MAHGIRASYWPKIEIVPIAPCATAFSSLVSDDE